MSETLGAHGGARRAARGAWVERWVRAPYSYSTCSASGTVSHIKQRVPAFRGRHNGQTVSPGHAFGDMTFETGWAAQRHWPALWSCRRRLFRGALDAGIDRGGDGRWAMDYGRYGRWATAASRLVTSPPAPGSWAVCSVGAGLCASPRKIQSSNNPMRARGDDGPASQHAAARRQRGLWRSHTAAARRPAGHVGPLRLAKSSWWQQCWQCWQCWQC